MKVSIKKIGKSSLILIGFFFTYALIGTYFIGFSNNETIKQYIENAVQFVMCIGLIFLFNKELKEDLTHFKKTSFQKFLKYLLIYLFAFFISSLINNTIYNHFEILPSNEIAVRKFIKAFPINGVLSAGLLAPFYEEIIIRLNRKNIFKRKWTFIIFSGILFGSFHMISAMSSIELYYILPYSILGICLSYIYCDSEAIYTSIGFHAINNLIQILLIFGGKI